MTDAEKRNANCLDDTDMELIGVLTAISVTSKRLAGKLLRLSQANHSQEGDRKANETVRSQSGYRGNL